MKRGEPKNVAASVRDRLAALARVRREAFASVLLHYTMERLLHRIGRSAHGEELVLKGAMLFRLWEGPIHRATRDLDLLGRGDPSVERMEEVFRAICTQVVEPDGLTFDPGSVRAEPIREGRTYRGVRIRLVAALGQARVPLQVDVGFGDAVVPPPMRAKYPTLLGHEPPIVNVYPREAVIAEKFQAMVELGAVNTRMKDFHDVWVLAQNHPFQGDVLTAAIRSTFARRNTDLPANLPLALSAEFAADASREAQWQAFLGRAGLAAQEAVRLADVVESLRGFLWPLVVEVNGGDTSFGVWPPGGPWAGGD